MTDAYSAADIAAILENFREQERAAAVFESRRQKIVFTRNIGSGQQLVNQANLECVIDQESTADEIYEQIAKFDSALDRQKAKLDLGEHYARLDMKIRELNVAINGRIDRERTFHRDNAKHAANRRDKVTSMTLTPRQEEELASARDGIARCRTEIAAIWELVETAKAIMRDGNPFEYLERDLRSREEAAVRSRAAA